MKNWGLLIGLVIVGLCVNGQSISGTVVTRTINSSYLQNTGGENPNRRISVYLPPGYEQFSVRYPVIYYLHGFLDSDNIRSNMKDILDLGISKGKIRPFILVISDQYTLFEGSFYSNSSLTATGPILPQRNSSLTWIRTSERFRIEKAGVLAAILWEGMGP